MKCCMLKGWWSILLRPWLHLTRRRMCAWVYLKSTWGSADADVSLHTSSTLAQYDLIVIPCRPTWISKACGLKVRQSHEEKDKNKNTTGMRSSLQHDDLRWRRDSLMLNTDTSFPRSRSAAVLSYRIILHQFASCTESTRSTCADVHSGLQSLNTDYGEIIFLKLSVVTVHRATQLT